MYRDFPQNEIIKGVKTWVNKNNKFNVIALHYTSDPDKDPDTEVGKLWYEEERKGMPKADWEKEFEMSSTSKAGKLIFGEEFCDFNPSVHFIQSFEWPDPVEYLISMDFGQRNPTCALVGIWTRNAELFIVDEYYNAAIPSVSSREMFEKFKYLFGDENIYDGKGMTGKRQLVMSKFSVRVIDPSTLAKNRVKYLNNYTKRMGEEIPYSVIEEFWDNGWDFDPGNNDVSTSITRIREYLKINGQGKTHLYIFKDKCPYLCHQFTQYRYKKLSESLDKTHNESEEPVKKDDHAVDALRYMIMTRPNAPELATAPKTFIQRDIERLTKPRNFTNDWDKGE